MGGGEIKLIRTKYNTIHHRTPTSIYCSSAMLNRLFPGRLRILWVLLVFYISVNGLVRIGLGVYNGESSPLMPWRLIPALLIGLGFDIGTAFFFLAPLGLLVLAWPNGSGKILRIVLLALLLPLCGIIVFVGFSEFTFWNEFAARFNFIAVEYLIYTNEVIGNIRESYNMPLLLSGVVVVTLGLWWCLVRALRQHWSGSLSRKHRAIAILVLLALPVLTVYTLDERFKEFSSDAQANELAGNGYYDFWHAFWSNEIDYERYYRVIPRQTAVGRLTRKLIGQRPTVTLSQQPFDHDIIGTGAPKRLNVVLISVESFSAEFMTAFGNKQGLTPNMDRLAKEGLLFTQIYATGTRTVRGLEALALSVPPTPGHSIVKRPNNDQLLTVGEIFNEKGYESLYLYGGYGYFDNMNTFFSGNGYTVLDRTALKAEDIHFENIWGVADEDLFTLALRQLDQRNAVAKPFFAHIMTTSNHRPFTYPEGRIDIPSKSGRDGGVKYTDWAIGNFIERAKTKPWFDNTLFVIVADHTHTGRGKQELPLKNYHIPLVFYAPAHVKPAQIATIASQIDVAPTILGLLNFSYKSKFFGHDILRDGPAHQRALMANYQTVGLYESGRVVELKPKGRVRIVEADSGREAPKDELSKNLVEEAISYYQLSSEAYRQGNLRKPATTVRP